MNSQVELDELELRNYGPGHDARVVPRHMIGENNTICIRGLRDISGEDVGLKFLEHPISKKIGDEHPPILRVFLGPFPPGRTGSVAQEIAWCLLEASGEMLLVPIDANEIRHPRTMC